MKPQSANLQQLANTIVPVVVIDTELTDESAKALCQAVIDGGSACLEITLRTPQALPAIKLIKEVCQDSFPNFLVGAGTVLTKEQVRDCVTVGVDFLVSPGLSYETVKLANELGCQMIPGVITPTEMQQAMSLGLELVKFFPAEKAGGAGMLKAFNAVYPNVKIMPTGGINLDNLEAYTALANVYAVGGSWVCTASDISEGKYTEITAKLTEANAKF